MRKDTTELGKHRKAGWRRLGAASARRLQPANARYDDSGSKIFSVFWHRKWVIAAHCAAAVVLAGAAVLLIGPRYTAKAVIQIDLRGRDSSAEAAPTTVLEGATLVESQTRMIQSQALARQVVKRLGQEEIQTASTFRLAVNKIMGQLGLSTVAPPSRLDIAASQLMGNLTVKNEPRTYLITVAYTAPNPQEAAHMANAVVSEYMHNRRLQTLAERHEIERRALLNLVVTYGDKHPLVVRAKENVSQARLRMEAEAEQTALMNDRELAETGQVVPAQAITIPSNARSSAILALALLGGLICGIALVLVLERRAFQ